MSVSELPARDVLLGRMLLSPWLFMVWHQWRRAVRAESPAFLNAGDRQNRRIASAIRSFPR